MSTPVPVKPVSKLERVMPWLLAAIAVSAICFLLSGCSLFDSATPEQLAEIQAAAEAARDAAAAAGASGSEAAKAAAAAGVAKAGEIAQATQAGSPESLLLGFLPAAYAPYAAILLIILRRLREKSAKVLTSTADVAGSLVLGDVKRAASALKSTARSALELVGGASEGKPIFKSSAT